jgi:acyl carrier protein
VEEAREAIIEALKVEVAAVLHLDDDSVIGARQGFFEMGMDSVMAIELARRVDRVVGMSLPRTIALECPNVAALADEIVVLLLPGIEASSPSMERPGEDEALHELGMEGPDEGAEALLLRELETLNY